MSTRHVKTRILPFRDGSYLEDHAACADVETGCWIIAGFQLGPGSLDGPIRIDPADLPCQVEIAEIKVFDANSHNMLLCGEEEFFFKQSAIVNSAILLPGTDRFTLFCFGTNPQFTLAHNVDFSGAIRIELLIRIEEQFARVAAVLRKANDPESATNRAKHVAEIEGLRNEIRASQSSRLLLAAELSQLATEKNFVMREKDEEVRRLENRLHKVEEQLKDSQAETQTALQRIEILAKSENSLLDLKSSVENSLSWRVTKPLRDVMRVLRGSRGNVGMVFFG